MARRIVPQVLCALILASVGLHGDLGDVENSRDYSGFPRQPGFLISDFTEDNPSDFEFPVAHPLPIDAGHVDTVPVHGHRYVIRYELSSGNSPSIYQTQRYYEKLAIDGGFTIEKTGGTGDTTETFHKSTPIHEVWIYLQPAMSVNVLTVMEAAPLPAALPPLPRISATPPPARAVMPTATLPRLPQVLPAPVVTPVPFTRTPTPAPPPPDSAADPDGDDIYAQLSQEGRVIVPFVFKPGRDEIDASSQSLVDRIAAMMKKHPEVFLRIEGHTDNTGDPDVNLRLSAQRALAVQSSLVNSHVENKRLDAVGVGGLQPLADNATAQGREKNRRIELVMWKKPGSHTPVTGTGPS
jgi:outer membrane protein OmpA-like peptidoglycan-associated protein